MLCTAQHRHDGDKEQPRFALYVWVVVHTASTSVCPGVQHLHAFAADTAVILMCFLPAMGIISAVALQLVRVSCYVQLLRSAPGRDKSL